MSQLTAVSEPALLGEGPLWDAGRSCLMWVDIAGSAVLEFDLATGRNRSERFDVPVGAVAHRDGGWFVFAAGMGFATWAWPNTELTWIATVDCGQRMNDAACDPAGRLLAGTLVTDGGGGAALYQLDRGEVRLLLADVSISNGLDWSLDGHTMYYIDTPLERVDAFDYDVTTGAIRNRRTLVDLHDVPGRPDGLTVDAEGGIWVAMARGGAAVRRFTPEGRLDQVVEMPVPNVPASHSVAPTLATCISPRRACSSTQKIFSAGPMPGHCSGSLTSVSKAVNRTRYASKVSSLRLARASPGRAVPGSALRRRCVVRRMLPRRHALATRMRTSGDRLAWCDIKEGIVTSRDLESAAYDAIILAGGAGTRLGGVDKSTVDVAGRTLLDRVLAGCSGARAVVVGKATANRSTRSVDDRAPSTWWAAGRSGRGLDGAAG